MAWLARQISNHEHDSREMAMLAVMSATMQYQPGDGLGSTKLPNLSLGQPPRKAHPVVGRALGQRRDHSRCGVRVFDSVDFTAFPRRSSFPWSGGVTDPPATMLIGLRPPLVTEGILEPCLMMDFPSRLAKAMDPPGLATLPALRAVLAQHTVLFGFTP